MSAYILVSYDVVDPDGFQGYVPAVQELLREHGAEVVVGAFDAKPLEGEKRDVYVVLRFDSEEAALAWYQDPRYEPLKKMRLDSCGNTNMVLVRPFVPPS